MFVNRNTGENILFFCRKAAVSGMFFMIIMDGFSYIIQNIPEKY